MVVMDADWCSSLGCVQPPPLGPMFFSARDEYAYACSGVTDVKSLPTTAKYFRTAPSTWAWQRSRVRFAVPIAVTVAGAGLYAGTAAELRWRRLLLPRRTQPTQTLRPRAAAPGDAASCLAPTRLIQPRCQTQECQTHLPGCHPSLGPSSAAFSHSPSRRGAATPGQSACRKLPPSAPCRAQPQRPLAVLVSICASAALTANRAPIARILQPSRLAAPWLADATADGTTSVSCALA